MSMLDSLFNKGFKAAKCKTLLKLTIPRIKLLRNRREIQIRQMRRDIAKLLETGQEATARIRVEHIIREENMMAAQEVVELFCELISVRLPIIEAQRECPLDLKEAISSVCFAAPRCADLPELLQVQMLFGMKYGKEFISAATELMPECGVNRQLIELLSIRAPSPEKKLKLLKEIAEEHEIDWDPAASETELLKPHEDLLNGPTQFVSGSKLPIPKEKHDETLSSTADLAHSEQPDSDADLDGLDFPEVPKVPLRPSTNVASAPEHASLNPNVDHELLGSTGTQRQESFPETKDASIGRDEFAYTQNESHDVVSGAKEDKQFLPFMSPPPVSSTSIARPVNPPAAISRTSDVVYEDLQDVLAADQTAAETHEHPPPTLSRKKGDVNVDLQDVISAAHAAAENAERAASAARSAASLAQARISEITKKNSDKFPDMDGENPFHTDVPDQPPACESPQLSHSHSFGDPDAMSSYFDSHQYQKGHQSPELPDIPSFDKLEIDHDTHPYDQGSAHHQPQRLPSIEDEAYFSYPNLFGTATIGSSAESPTDSSHPTHRF